MVNPNINLASLGHQVLDDQEGEVTSVILLTTTKEGKGSVMIAGYMNGIVSSIANAMKAQPEFRKAFECAWTEATKAEIGMN